MSVRLSRDKLIEWGYDPETLDRLIAAAAPPLGGTGARGRPPAHTRGTMNYTEARFSHLLDDGRWPLGQVERWEFETDNLVLAPDMTFLPDFKLYMISGEVDYVDVKGKMVWEDSLVKARAAAVIYPAHRFYVAKLANGAWSIRQMGVKGRKTVKVEVNP
jgi:hypothetical protein